MGIYSHFVKGWLNITGAVHKPIPEHIKRPIHGLNCERREVSGTRFWSLMEELCGTAENMFTNCYVHNYCPLCFMTQSGKNVTPADLKVADRKLVEQYCDIALITVVELLQVR